MRHRLILAFTLGLFSAACGGGNPSSTTGGSSTGATAGSGTTTGGQQNLLPGAPCTSNGQCETGRCGVDGTGNCCAAACIADAGACSATGCSDAGACAYPGTEAACGDVSASCSNGVEQLPSTCNGFGSCNSQPATQDCAPFLCGATECLASCTDATSCVTGAYCDVADAVCCPALAKFGKVAVDAAYGQDAPCCGTGKDRACKTLTQAMKIIDIAKAQNVTITATVNDGGGDWAPVGERYPIVLGWGAEVIAAGIAFNDQSGAAEIFDVAAYSASDTVGFASITGSPASPVQIGMNLSNQQSNDGSAVQIEGGNTLYIANANLNGNATLHTNAVTVAAGGKLVAGQDRSAGFTGVVTIGNDVGDPATNGWNGIVCGSSATAGCTISDSPLNQSSGLVIIGQAHTDIEAEDNASITLSSGPVIGVPPAQPGFRKCARKVDGSSATSQAVLLHGKATFSMTDGAVQCISGNGFELQASAAGTPTLTLSHTTIQNTDNAIHAAAGKVTVSNSTIRYNYRGVWQDTDGTNSGTIDLSGGSLFGTNTVVCSSTLEASTGTASDPGVCVLDTTSTNLDADSVIWDTPGPDVYTCTPTPPSPACVSNSYTCVIASCTNPPTDGIDVLEEGSGTISTLNNQLMQGTCAGT